MSRTLSPKDAALALGVSESSLKRWVDDGRLGSARTLGGHRRIPAAEVVRFARAADLPIVRGDVLGLPDVAEARRRRHAGDALDQALFEALRLGRGPDAQAIVLDLYLAGEPIAAICDGPVRSAVHRIGDLWQHDPRGIFQEHRATDVVIQAFNLLRNLVRHRSLPPSQPEADRPPDPATVPADLPAEPALPVALGGAPAHDPYLLPSLMAACVVADLGFRDVNLGPDTPLATLLHAAEHHRPRLVWLSCSATATPLPTPAELDRLAADLVALGSPLLLGGRTAPKLPPTHHPNLHPVPTMAEFAAFARGVLAATP